MKYKIWILLAMLLIVGCSEEYMKKTVSLEDSKSIAELYVLNAPFAN